MDERSVYSHFYWLGLCLQTVTCLFLYLGVCQAYAKRNRHYLRWMIPIASSFIIRVVLEWFMVLSWRFGYHPQGTVYNLVVASGFISGVLLTYGIILLWINLKHGSSTEQSATGVTNESSPEGHSDIWPPSPKL